MSECIKEIAYEAPVGELDQQFYGIVAANSLAELYEGIEIRSGDGPEIDVPDEDYEELRKDHPNLPPLPEK